MPFILWSPTGSESDSVRPPNRKSKSGSRSWRDTLIAAPTGSGKTLAAFLAALDSLIRQAADSKLADRTQVLYVSPLRALSNDIQKYLREPLRELRERAARSWVKLPEIRVSVRTC